MTKTESSPLPIYKIGVRALSESIYQTGGLSSAVYSGISGAEGTRLHRKVFALLKQQFPSDILETEYPLSYTHILSDLAIEISGRADCLFLPTAEDAKPTIIEIKSCNQRFSQITEVKELVHWNQLKLYGCLYLLQNPHLSGVQLELRYVSIENLETISDNLFWPVSEAIAFLESSLNKFVKTARDYIKYEKKRNASIKNLTFPYPKPRLGQKNFMDAVLQTISSKNCLFVQAPTGIGKTISSLFPGIKALGHKKCEKIFYLTAKISTRTVAEKALEDLRQNGLFLRSITLYAKEKLCLFPDLYCDTNICPGAISYYKRQKEALEDLKIHFAITKTNLLEVAQKHQVCPHELALDMSLFCDVILGDYNHAFHPRAKIERYFDTSNNNFLLLIDEAHNFISRSRAMFSSTFDLLSAQACQKNLLGMDAKVDGYMADVISYLVLLNESLKREEVALDLVEKEIEVKDIMVANQFRATALTPKMLYKILWKFCYFVRPILDLIPAGLVKKTILEFYFQSRFFLSVMELYFDTSYVFTAEIKDNNLFLTLDCLDASAKINQFIYHKIPTCFFSATLSPLHYYRTMILGDDANIDYLSLELASPFPPENLQIGLYKNIKTTYKERMISATALSQLLIKIAQLQTANFLIFFPSFQYLNVVMRNCLEILAQENLENNIKIICQKNQMSEGDKQQFLSHFQHFGFQTLLGFAVLGGHFGEGIDLLGDTLKGVIIIGTGLPQISPQQEIYKQYFDQKFGSGFEFAYGFPGWEKVLQGAGRVIRQEEDTGWVLLIDPRFDTPNYHELFPDHWQVKVIEDVEELFLD